MDKPDYLDPELLALLTARQADGIEYLTFLHGNVQMKLLRRPDGTVLYFAQERVAALDTEGNFLDVSTLPDDAPITLAWGDYITTLQRFRSDEAAMN